MREKLRISNKGKKTSVAVRKKLSISAKSKGFGKWMKGKNLSEETKKKISEGLKGNKSPRWKGGITPENRRIRHSREYKLWRIAVFERDNYACIWCGKRSQKGEKVILHADHIKQFAYFPELRFAIDNGRTLCVDCHKTTDTYKKYKRT